MCGRYRLTRSQKQLKEHFNAYGEVEVFPRYNIAPSQSVVTTAANPELENVRQSDPAHARPAPLRAAAKKRLEIDRFKSLPDLARHLQQSGVITPAIAEFANDAWQSRNRVLHDRQNDVGTLNPKEQFAKFRRLIDDHLLIGSL